MHSKVEALTTSSSPSGSRVKMQNASSGLLTTREAADLIGVSEKWFQAMGLPPSGKQGKWNLYRQSDVDLVIAERRLAFERLKRLKSKRRVRA